MDGGDAAGLRTLSDRLALNSRGLGRITEGDARKIRRCKNGTDPVPAALLAWLRRQAALPSERRPTYDEWLARTCDDPPPLKPFDQPGDFPGLPPAARPASADPDEGVGLD